MINYIAQLVLKIKTSCQSASTLIKKSLPKHAYRVLSIEQNEDETYVAVVQITNTSQVFRMSPEEILASDETTDLFSQRDIRTLTYLGYLGINGPKYKILAKRLCENDSSLIFAIRERGKKQPIIKTAREISCDDKLMSNLHQKDAHMVGYAIATEDAINEEKQKKDLLNALEKKHDSET